MNESWINLVKEIIVQSLNRNMLPFPTDKKICTGWTKELPRENTNGNYLYTSCMYQLEPIINMIVKYIEATKVNEMEIGVSIVKPLLSLSSLVLKPTQKSIERYYNILNKIASKLREVIDFAYMYEEEPYSGSLLYELGFSEEFSQYAEKVIKVLREKGVKRLITIDPHSYNIFLNVYPKYTKIDFDVVNYLELIKPKGKKLEEAVIHDPCLYARFTNMYDTYRKLLDLAGIKRIEDYMVTSKENSTCCGGPIEALDPGTSNQIARTRMSKLTKLSSKIIVLCPICMGMLERNSKGAEILDISEIID
jgi:Fe-S oxidoreductase